MRIVGEGFIIRQEDNVAKEDAAKEGVEEQASLDADYRSFSCC